MIEYASKSIIEIIIIEQSLLPLENLWKHWIMMTNRRKKYSCASIISFDFHCGMLTVLMERMFIILIVVLFCVRKHRNPYGILSLFHQKECEYFTEVESGNFIVTYVLQCDFPWIVRTLKGVDDTMSTLAWRHWFPWSPRFLHRRVPSSLCTLKVLTVSPYMKYQKVRHLGGLDSYTFVLINRPLFPSL